MFGQSGNETRTRTCSDGVVDNCESLYSGTTAEEVQGCATQTCPGMKAYSLNLGKIRQTANILVWSTWSAWENCDVSGPCGQLGNETRTRTCSDGVAANCASLYSGTAAAETQDYATALCPSMAYTFIHLFSILPAKSQSLGTLVWQDWNEWASTTGCSTEMQVRTRACHDPTDVLTTPDVCEVALSGSHTETQSGGGCPACKRPILYSSKLLYVKP